MKIKGNVDVGNIKRFNVETIVKAVCPKCGQALTCSLRDYFEYPEVGKKDTISFYCETCEQKGETDYMFEMPITLVKCEATFEFNPLILKPV